MNNRWLRFFACALLGLVARLGGLLIPAYLRAVDAGVIQRAGQKGSALTESGLKLAQENRLGAAQLMAQAAVDLELPDREKLTDAVSKLSKRHPEWLGWGGGDTRVENFFSTEAATNRNGATPLTDYMVPAEIRGQVLTGWLAASQRPLVQELLRFRSASNTVVFTPSASASGQILDTAICVCGFLVERGQLSSGLNNKLLAAVTGANGGGGSESLEQALLDLMSLGQRFNYGQLVTFIGKIDDLDELRISASMVRNNEGQLPIVFSAVRLADDVGPVARYLTTFSESGAKDLGWSLAYGRSGVNELLRRNQRVQYSDWREHIIQRLPLGWLFDFALRASAAALVVKWVLYVGGGFLLALAMHFARPPVSALERPLQVGGFHLARELLFALGFLVVILLSSEPFLAQESQKKPEVTLRLQLPSPGVAIPEKTADGESKFMNANSLLTLLLFFVLQALLYVASLVKLAEIRRQKASPRVKLKLLENEEHLFDAGLYLGFAGTIVSLILVSMGVMQPSLMAAYGSTSFGIIFVSIFKIFHLRQLRRQLLLESETLQERTQTVPSGSTLAAPL